MCGTRTCYSLCFLLLALWTRPPLCSLCPFLPPSQVHEPDDVWDEDMLFTAVASELHREKEKAEGPSDTDGKDTDQTMPVGM